MFFIRSVDFLFEVQDQFEVCLIETFFIFRIIDSSIINFSEERKVNGTEVILSSAVAPRKDGKIEWEGRVNKYQCTANLHA